MSRLKPFLIGGAVIIAISLAGLYFFANKSADGDPSGQANNEPTLTESESSESLPQSPVEQIVEAFNAGDKETLEMYFPEEFRGQEWSVEEIIGDGTFVIGNSSDPDNAISRTYPAWTKAEDGSVIEEFELVLIYDGTQWLIASL